MIIFSKYKGTIFYIIPMPFVATGRCEVCNAAVLLIGLSIGNWLLTMQIHPVSFRKEM
jgi:hypothetical protein